MIKSGVPIHQRRKVRKIEGILGLTEVKNPKTASKSFGRGGVHQKVSYYPGEFCKITDKFKFMNIIAARSVKSPPPQEKPQIPAKILMTTYDLQ